MLKFQKLKLKLKSGQDVTHIILPKLNEFVKLKNTY